MQSSQAAYVLVLKVPGLILKQNLNHVSFTLDKEGQSINGKAQESKVDSQAKAHKEWDKWK